MPCLLGLGRQSVAVQLVGTCLNLTIREASPRHAIDQDSSQPQTSTICTRYAHCRGVQVRPYPTPLGNDGKLPLLSSNADTFHAANAHRGTIVKDCYFVNAGKGLDPRPNLHLLFWLLYLKAYGEGCAIKPLSANWELQLGCLFMR